MTVWKNKSYGLEVTQTWDNSLNTWLEELDTWDGSISREYSTWTKQNKN